MARAARRRRRQERELRLLDSRPGRTYPRQFLVAVVAGLAVATLVVLMVVNLANITQNRHDTDRHEGTSRIVLHVETKRGFDPQLATQGLWAACQTTVLQNRLAGLTARPDARMELAVQPALGEHARRRLVGCLEDATLDLVRANVETVADD